MSKNFASNKMLAKRGRVYQIWPIVVLSLSENNSHADTRGLQKNMRENVHGNATRKTF